jgi:transcription initiation factor TFIIB
MNILEKQNCPECKSTLVDDMQNGEINCKLWSRNNKLKF